MQTFNKKQIAVAIGAALAAGAVAAAAPALRTANPLQANNVPGNLNELELQTIWNPATTATGVVGAANAVGAALTFAPSATFVKFSNLTILTDSTASQGAVFVNVVDSASAKVSLNGLIAVTGAVNAPDTTAGALLNVTLTPSATGAIRLQSGKLQYMDSASSIAALNTFRDVQFTLNAGDTTFTNGGVIFTDEDSSGAFDTTTTTADTRIATATLASVTAGHTLIPNAVAYTRATNGKVDGAKIETFTPLASFAASNVVVRTVATGSVTNNGVADTTFAAAADTTTASTSLYQVSWTAPQSVNWVTDSTVADSSAYNAATFNTGITGAGVPFAFTTDTSVAGFTAAAVYTQAFFESTGTNASFDSTTGLPAAGTILDGVAPVALSSQYDTAASELEIIFSEAITVNTGDTTTPGNKREIVENVSHKVGTTTTTLAAEAFNANATGGASVGFSIGTPAGTGVAANTRLLLSGVPKAVLDTATAHTVEIGSRLTIAEPGDANFSTAAALDAEGGLKANAFSNLDSTIMAFNAPSTNVARQTLGGTGVAIAREVLPSAFDSATGSVTAAAFLTSDNTKIQTIVVTFPGNVTVDSTATLTDQFVIEQKDSNGTPYSDTTGGQSLFRFIPTAAQVSGGGTTKLTFTLPTTLEPANARNTWTIEYLGSNNVLKDANSQNYAAGTVNITLPFTAANTTVGLYTMDAKLPLVGAAPGSRLTTYVAKWNDVATGDRYDSTGANAGFTFRSSRISNPNDRIATDILLEPRDGNWGINGGGQLDTLVTAMAVELNKVGTTTKPSAIPLYVQFIRGSDVAKNANNVDAEYQQARALFSTNPDDLDVGSRLNFQNNEMTQTYVVSLDPVTGNITGRLTGRIDIASRKTAGATGAGLVFLDSNGVFGNFAGAVKSASVLDSASAGRIFIGAERKDNARAFDGAFLLSVLEQQAAGVDTNTLVTSGDPGAKNFFAFTPSLDVRDPNRVGRTTLQAVPLAQLRTAALTNSTAWQLVGIGNLDRTLPIVERDVPKGFIAYAPTGNIALDSIWLGDGATADMALTMIGNNTALSVEGTTGATRGNLAPKGNAAAFALMDDVGTANKMSWLLKATSDNTTPTGIGSATGLGLPAGWSLVAVPAGVTSTTNLPANVTMLLKVGAQRGIGGAVSWVTGDPAQTLAQGEPVFVFARAAVAGR